MIRATIEECINLFNSDISMRQYAIKGMEQLSEWDTAAAYWDKIGDKENAAVCRYIRDAIAMGDSLRGKCKELNEWVDNTVAEGILTKEEAVNVVYPKIHEIYNKHFNIEP